MASSRSVYYIPCSCTRCIQQKTSEGHCQCVNCPDCVRRAMLAATGSAATQSASAACRLEPHQALIEATTCIPDALLYFVSPTTWQGYSCETIRWDADHSTARTLRRTVSAMLGNLIREVREATNAEHGEPARGASQAAIDSLKKVEFRPPTPVRPDDDAVICPICQCNCEGDHSDGGDGSQMILDSIQPMVEDKAAADVVCMPCGHKFHRGCLLPWLQIHHSCPTCRYKLTPATTKLEAARARHHTLRRLLTRLYATFHSRSRLSPTCVCFPLRL